MDCALVCPDAAIPNTVHEVHDLLLTAVGRIEADPGQKDSLRQAVYGISERAWRLCDTRTSGPSHEVVASAAAGPA